MLAEKKKLMRERGLDVKDVPPSVMAAGYNPKDSPEQFIEKVLNQSKRMNNTIAIYEKKQNEEALKNELTSIKSDIDDNMSRKLAAS